MRPSRPAPDSSGLAPRPDSAMKISISTLLPALLLFPLSNLTAHPSVSEPPTGSFVDEAKFRADFEKAMTVNAKDEMRKLVRQNKDDAVAWIIDLAFKSADAPNEKIVLTMKALTEAWSAELKTDFPRKMERYFARMNAPTKKARKLHLDSYNQASQTMTTSIEQKNNDGIIQAGARFESLAEDFQEIGDSYWMSQCWVSAAVCFDEGSLESAAQLERVTTALKNGIAGREAVELEDKIQFDSRERLKTLNGMGYGVPAKPEGEPGVDGEPGEPGAAADLKASPLAPRETGPALTIATEFRALEDPFDYQRPNYFADQHYPIWHAIYFQDKGSIVSIPRLSGPQAIRSGASKGMLDVDGDGEGDVDLPLRSKDTLVEFEYGTGDSKRKAALWTKTGQEQELYQGITANMAPQDNRIDLYVSPASTVVGEIDGTEIRVIDENLSGGFGDPPTSWSFQGLTKGTFQPEHDSVLIGSSKTAVPWSDYLQIDKQWYRMEVLDGGLSFKATPIDVATGTITLKFKGPKPDHMILVGSDTFAGAYIDIADGSVEVPTGTWSLYYGIVGKGKNKQRIKALVLPTATMQKWHVDRDAKVTVELGGPFDMDFEVQVEGDLVTVPGTSVVITGVAGEHYERLWNCVPKTTMSYRKGGKGRGSKPDRMGVVGSTEELYKDYNSAWFPKTHTLEKKSSETEIEVQLVDKKNKLFGKVESSWRS